ncbi:MAG TPA: FtsX-like permease family protein, partial [Flavisolibacter sp.]|nr:FtsX-like permease family protein [Flavisolibacter sp.]
NRLNGRYSIVDSNFFQVFDFKIKEGNTSNPFTGPNTVLISELEAKRIFGNEPAIGKDIQLTLGDSTVMFTVAGIVENPPFESSIQYAMLIPFSNAKYIWSEKVRTSAWSNVSVQTYVEMKPGASLQQVHQKIDAATLPLVAMTYKPGQYLVRLQPLSDVYFNKTLPEEVESESDPKYSYILATIGILILLIACINFVTLSIGRSVTRALEVGVRKVMGAGRRQIITQFWSEMILLTFTAVVLGVIMAFGFLKSFNQLANRELIIRFDPFTIILIMALVIVIALIAGIYPSLVLSNFKPIQVLKGNLRVGNMGFFRKALVVGQFVASIMMIIGTLTISQQLDYIRTKNLGYDREHIIIVPTGLNISEGRSFAQRFQTELQKNPNVINSSTAIYALHNYGWMSMGYKDDKNVFRQFLFNAVDPDFVSTMGLAMAKGRNFQKGNTADSNYIIVNEALVKEYGWKDPIGQKLPGKYEQTIIGVVKDFNIETLYTPVKPTILALKPKDIFEKSTDISYNDPPRPRVSIRFKPGNVEENVAYLKSTWKALAGDREFDSVFLDDSLAAAYAQEQRLGKIIKYASILSIFIACMGLFGLATLVVVRRTKEIGIRKVLGADVGNVVALLSKDFILMVVIASFIAFPLSWWALQNWLEDFAYRIPIAWWVFLIAAITALVVALATVSFQAIKAALTNPVKSLRTE